MLVSKSSDNRWPRRDVSGRLGVKDGLQVDYAGRAKRAADASKRVDDDKTFRPTICTVVYRCTSQKKRYQTEVSKDKEKASSTTSSPPCPHRHRPDHFATNIRTSTTTFPNRPLAGGSAHQPRRSGPLAASRPWRSSGRCGDPVESLEETFREGFMHVSAVANRLTALRPHR